MSDRRVDRQLLLGLLGLQCALITRDQLVAAFSVWTGSKDRDLADILVDQQALTGERRTLLAALVEQHLQQHGNDPEQSLRQLSSIDSVRDDLHQLADPDVQISLATVGGVKRAAQAEPREYDPFATAPPPSESQPAGGRFVVVQPLARGGLGSVSIAKDLELNRHVAFKQILPDIADNLDAQVRFKREAEITGGLEHPGIVPIYGLGTYANGRPFYAMKLIRGDSLKEAISRFHADRAAGKVGFDSPEFRNLLRRLIDVCNAIQYAHDRGVLHRDLKPGNVMLGKYGETLVVDWGLAKPLAEESPEKNAAGDAERVDPQLVPRTSLSQSGSTETQTGEAKGTPAYMSPEQARGDWETLGPATDIYALGATLYSILTGKPPIEAADAGEAVQKAAKGDWRAPREITSSVPRPLDAVCLRAMATQPTQRYAAAAKLAEDLEHWLADDPVSATPETTGERLGRLTRKHRSAVMTLLAASLLLAVGGVTASFVINGFRNAAVDLAQRNQDLAENNQDLANDNAAKAKLAEEQAAIAKVQSELAENRAVELDRQLTVFRSAAYSAQVKQASLIAESQPADALNILFDERRCPSEFREFTWGLLNRVCQRNCATLAGHSGCVTSVAFSPDGRILASGSALWDESAQRVASGEIKLWDVASGQERATLAGHRGGVDSVSFSPDGRILASGGALWDESAQRIVSGEIKLWDVASGQERATLAGHSKLVRSVSFSPDGRTLASGSEDHTIKLWDVASGQERTTLTGHDTYVTSVSFSPDGRTLASGSWDKTIKLWDVASGQERATLAGHRGGVDSVSFSPDGRTLASGSYDAIKLWDVASGQERATLARHSDPVRSVAFSPDGRTLASGSDGFGKPGEIKLWDVASGQERATLAGHSGGVASVSYSPDGRTLASGGALWDESAQRIVSGEIKLWDVASGQERATLAGHSEGVTSVSFSPDGRTLASGSYDKTIKLWDVASGQERATLTGHSDPVRSVSFSPDGRTLASGSWDQTIKLWDIDVAFVEEPRRLAARLVSHGADLSVAESERNWSKACANLHPLIAGFPKNADFRARRGRAYAELGWWPEAVEDWRAAVDLAPHEFGPRQELAWALLAAVDTTALEQLWSEWSVQFGNADAARTLDLLARTRLLWPIADQTELATVTRWARSAAEIDPESWSYLETLGAAEFRSGNPAAASAALSRSATLQRAEADKWTLWTRLHLALALQAAGDINAARRVDFTIPESEPMEADWESRLVWRTLYPELREKLGPVVDPPRERSN